MAHPYFTATFSTGNANPIPNRSTSSSISSTSQDSSPFLLETHSSSSSSDGGGTSLPFVQIHTRLTRNCVIGPGSGRSSSSATSSSSFAPELQQDHDYLYPAMMSTMPRANNMQPSSASSKSTSEFLNPSLLQQQNINTLADQQQPLSMRLSMPFRTAFSRHGDLRSKLFHEDLMDNVFQLDRRRFGFNNNHSLSSLDNLVDFADELASDDLFANFDDRDSSTASGSAQQPHFGSAFGTREFSPFRTSVNSPKNFSTTSPSSSQRGGPDKNVNMAQGELEDTIHHIIHSEAPDQLQQRVKIFIAQDRARSLDSNLNSPTRQQHFPRISARFPHGGSLSFSFSTSSTTMHINDGTESGQVPPHAMLTIEQKKQLKERLLAQKNEFISGPNTSATILSSGPDTDGRESSGVGHQATSGSVAERVMWFEGFPQLQITHQPGRTHRSAAHIALQNWKNANPDMLDFPRPHSVERDIPIIRETDSTPPNRNAISITLEVPAKQNIRVNSAPAGDATPSKPGNHAFSIPSPTPQSAIITESPQKVPISVTQKASSKGFENKPVERIIPTILPSPEPKHVDKKWLKDGRDINKDQGIKPALVKQFPDTKDSPVTTKSAELQKASENIIKALQNGMKSEEKKDEIKATITPLEKPKPKAVSPPKTVLPPVPLAVVVKEDIPRFHYPRGKPMKGDNEYVLMEKVRKSFNGKTELKLEEMTDLMKSLGLPLYWRKPLLLAAVGTGPARSTITFEMLWNTWKRITSNCYDDASRFVCLLAKPGCNYLIPNDFTPLVQDVVDTHPGLNILKEAPEFHARYINTVIARIFFTVNRLWSGHITIEELRRSNFLQILATLEHEDDINVITDYFSYEHFYVIYCKFWELDRDHDLLIDKTDLARHNDHALSAKMIDRIFSGAVTRGPSQKDGKMSYSEFVWFLISEEDKRHPTSVEYWFRCMDTDGDGVLSLFELEYFYEEQLQRMKSLGIEALPFEDIACQMLDMVHPKLKDKILLTDLKRCRMTPLFFDTFFNIEKYLLHEHRDPFASAKVDVEDNEPISDWERYAAEEYEMLVSEDTASEEL